MKRTILFASLALIVLGFIARIYADQNTYVTAEGMLVESIWTPIGALMTVIGFLALIILGIVSAIGYLRNRQKK